MTSVLLPVTSNRPALSMRVSGLAAAVVLTLGATVSSPALANDVDSAPTPALALEASSVATTIESLSLVDDINPSGSAFGNPSELADLDRMVAVDGTLYFAANDGSTGPELWKATAAGAVPVGDINPGPSGSNPEHLTVLDASVYFAAFTSDFGTELYTSDGSSVTLVSDIATGPGVSSGPEQLTVIGDWLYFSAFGANAREPYRTQGGGVVSEIADIHPSFSSDPREFIGFDGNVYFVATDPLYGTEIWLMDGSGSGALPRADFFVGTSSSNPTDLTVFGDWVYVSAEASGLGRELQRFNRTSAQFVANINPGAAGSLPYDLTVFGDHLYFAARDDLNGIELWRTDGTFAGTEEVRDINTNGANGSNPLELTVWNNWLYFGADDGEGYEVWRTNGTTTQKVTNIRPGAGTSALKNDLVEFVVMGDFLYFAADDGVTGRELWRTNGTTVTERVSDLRAGIDGSNPAALTVMDGALYFQADDGVNGSELWRYAAVTTDRLAGTDRFATSIAVSQSSHPDGAATVFIATGANYPDALAAGPAAAALDAPLLLTASTSLPSAVRTELQRLNPSQIVIVGGTGVVSNAVRSALQSAVPGAAIDRLFGADRYETGRKIVEEVFTNPANVDTVYIATGRNFPDALSAGAAGGSSGSPVILVDGLASSIPAATVTLIENLDPNTIKIAGGTGVVSPSIQSQLSGIATTIRLSGADRYATSLAINDDAYASGYSRAFLATGLNFPDALAGAPFAGSVDAPLYVVPRSCVPGAVHDALSESGVVTVTLLGGTGVLTAAVATLTRCS